MTNHRESQYMIDHTISRLFCLSPNTRRIEIEADSIRKCNPAVLVETLRAHALHRFFYAVLREHQLLQLLPDEQCTFLERNFAEGLAMHRSDSRNLADLWSAFQSAGLPFILLKEYAFSDLLSPAGCTIQNDFDFLIHPSDLPAATGLIERLGYRRVPRPWDNEYRYKCNEKKTIDLQTEFNPSAGWMADAAPRLDMIFNRKKCIDVEGNKIAVLHPIDNAIFLLFHVSLHHHFVPLSKIASCWNYLVMKQDEIDPGALTDFFNSSGLAHLYWHAINYMERMTGYSMTYLGKRPSPSMPLRNLFRYLLPEPQFYFSEKNASRMNARHFHRWFSLLYCSSWKMKCRATRALLFS